MGYRIVYEQPGKPKMWLGALLLMAAAVWMLAGEGWYEALARYVGGMIRGA